MESEAAALWPAIPGSLSFRRSRCGRHNCPAYLSGAQHQSHVLYGRHNGRRFAVYVPEDLVPEVRRGVDNGRALQDLLVQAGPLRVRRRYAGTRRRSSGQDRRGSGEARQTKVFARHRHEPGIQVDRSVH
jgi:hypothetical protein